MMGKHACPKCTGWFENTVGQKTERKTVVSLLKMISVAGTAEKHLETKDYCYDCWKKEWRQVVKPFAQALGKNAEGW